MPCIRIAGGIVCMPKLARLRLADGRRVFMEMHSYFGPTFFRDRAYLREIQEWWDDPLIVQAWDWFYKRGQRA